MIAKVHPGALAQMRVRTSGRWAAYENQALDSANAGHLQFLLVGAACTYQKPPEQYPYDTAHGMGWRYRFAGYVDLEKGTVSR